MASDGECLAAGSDNGETVRVAPCDAGSNVNLQYVATGNIKTPNDEKCVTLDDNGSATWELAVWISDQCSSL